VKVVRILIVDRDHNARLALKEILTDEGYDVRTTGNGSEALAQLAAHHPHVILCDQQMPAPSPGRELYQVLSASSSSSALILMSAHDAGQPINGALRLGKPIDVAQLLSAVAAAVSTAGVR
jgi:CheY-like chemotaxis protein